MVNECTVLFDSEAYYPGQIINGRVECNFLSEDKVRAIRVKFKGRAKVSWQRGRSHYNDEQILFEMVSDLLTCETTFPPGKYSYPFNFNLPAEIPPTFNQLHGNVKYYAEATIDRPWAIDYKDKRVFTVHSHIDLNMIPNLWQPFDINKVKKPFTFFNESGPITLSVHLPVTGYVPSQMIAFTAKLKNDSKVNVQGVQFQLLQRFTFHTEMNSKELKTVNGQIFEIINSSVTPGNENSWDLELRVPQEMFTGNLKQCKLVMCFVELLGEAVLPLPHRSLKLTIPIIIGAVPLRK